MKLSLAFVLIGGLVLGSATSGCQNERAKGDHAPRLGYVKSPLAAPLFLAEAGARTVSRTPTFSPVEFGSGGDVGYALLSGDVEAGLIEPAKASALFRLADNLRPVGAVTYPSGTTLVLRKDLALRLGELGGRTVAMRDSRCGLVHRFMTDAERLGVEAETLRFVPVPFDGMVPALEAGKVDAILTRGGHALLAVAAGHKILYQSWETVGADECCPQTLAQIELVLVVRNDLADASLRALVVALQEGSANNSPAARQIVSERTGVPVATLSPFPLASFEALSPEQQGELMGKPDNALGDMFDPMHDHEPDHECGEHCSDPEHRSTQGDE